MVDRESIPHWLQARPLPLQRLQLRPDCRSRRSIFRRCGHPSMPRGPPPRERRMLQPCPQYGTLAEIKKGSTTPASGEIKLWVEVAAEDLAAVVVAADEMASVSFPGAMVDGAGEAGGEAVLV